MTLAEDLVAANEEQQKLWKKAALEGKTFQEMEWEIKEQTREPFLRIIEKHNWVDQVQ